jgi:predicted acetylornithine/succinylornithine family transaminase
MTTTTESARKGLLGVYQPPDVLFVRGEGCELVDDEGRRYLDFTSGIGVTSLGHGSPVVRAAVDRALDSGLIHTSNVFRTRPAEELAHRLVSLAGMDRAFFCNSGAESVEAALKFARRWARHVDGAEKHEIVALRGSFHGRLFGSLAVTDRPSYQEPFQPLMPGARFVDPLDEAALDRALDPDRVAALIAEPVQGEGGVRPLSHALLQRMRAWTEERGIALILDEVQCGLGRTGEVFAHQAAGIVPDILTLAKPLAGGLPMGATLVTEEVADAIQPGDHATTFGGGPLVASAALAVVEYVSRAEVLEQVRARGRYLQGLLSELVREHEGVVQERGRGLIRGLELDSEAGPVVARAREKGLLVVSAGPNVVRFLPPFIVTEAELDRGVSILREALK